MGLSPSKDVPLVVLDTLNKLVKLVDEEKTLIENLAQNLDAMRNPTKVEETTNGKLIDKEDVEMVSNMTDTLVSSNDFVRDSCKTLINSVRSMIKSATNINEIGSKQPIHTNAWSDQHDDSASSKFKSALDTYIAILLSIRYDITQRNGNVNSKEEASSDIDIPDSDLKAEAQGQEEDVNEYDCIAERLIECLKEHDDHVKAIERTMHDETSTTDQQRQLDTETNQPDTASIPCKNSLSDEDWLLAKNNYAHLKECVHDLVSNTIDTKRQATLNLNSLIGQCVSTDETDKEDTGCSAAFVKQNAKQSNYREQVKASKTVCVYELLSQFKQATMKHDMLEERTRELTVVNEDKKKGNQTNVLLQLYYQQNDDLTQALVKEICSLITCEMKSYDVNIGVLQCTDPSQIKPSIPSLVLCISLKGHKMNVDEALAGIKRTKQTALLVFRYTDKYDIPTRKNDTAAQDIGGIFVFPLLRNKERYFCRFNSKVLRSICEFIKEHMPIQLQLYHKRNDELMGAVVKELESKLKCQMESVGVDIDVIECSNASKLKPGIHVLVLCISTTVVELDVRSSLEEIECTKQTALVVFHHKNMHVNINRTSDQIAIGQEFGGVFDVVFQQNKGIYTCDFNKKALENLRDFISKKT